MLLGCILEMAGIEAYGFNPGGGSADGRLEIVERHAVFADSWGQ